MLFSVTLSTAVHLAWAVFLCAVFAPRLAGRSFGHWLDGTESQIHWARYGLAVLAGLSVALSVWAAWQIVAGSPHLLNGFITLFAAYHGWLVWAVPL